MKDIQVKVQRKQNMVTEQDKAKENNPNFAVDMEIIEKLSSISIENNAEKTGNAFKKFLERINEFNNGEK